MARKIFAVILTTHSAYAYVKIAFSQVGQESDWRTANTEDIARAITSHQGWMFIYDDAQQKQENQIKALRNFITQNVDYILFTPIVSTGWDEVLKEVNEAEIPIIFIDRMPDCTDKIDYAAAFGGDFVIMEGTTGASAQTGLTEGNLLGLKSYSNLKLIARQSGNFTRAEGQALMDSWLKSLPKIDVLIAQNDDMALGAIDAIKAAGKIPGKDIIIVGGDGVKAAFDAIIAGDMNCNVECTPIYSRFIVDATEGGINLGTATSKKAADIITSRVY